MKKMPFIFAAIGLFFMAFIISCSQHEHVYEETAVAATCTEKGYTHHVCSCGDDYKDNYTEPTGHHYVRSVVEDPTCETEGKAMYQCSDCQDIYYESIDKLEHVPVTDPAKSPTCTEDGLTEGSHCSLCGKVITAQEIINKLGHVSVIDPSVDATFESSGLSSGSHCSRCGEILTPQEVIPKLEYTDYAYAVDFVYDSDIVSVEVFNTQDVSEGGTYVDRAYSRDSSSGALVKTGSGQVNFILHYSSDYVIESITIDGSYKNLKDSSDTDVEDCYRITKISSNLTVTINLCSVSEVQGAKMMSGLGYHNENGSVTYSWTPLYHLSKIAVSVTNNGAVTYQTIDGSSTEWTYAIPENSSCSFTFTPYISDSITGQSVSSSCSNIPGAAELAFDKISLTTRNYVFPTCDIIEHPNSWTTGVTITNAEYVDCSVALINAANETLYDSSQLAVDKFASAKTKIRGNTSATLNKKSLKLKLTGAANLLSYYGLTEGTNASKEWVLLACGYSINTALGREMTSLVSSRMWNPSYHYIQLFMNGDYLGIYILCESVNEKNIGIDTTGYVIECDAYWWNEDLYFDTPNTMSATMKYTFKYLETESSECIQYIRNYVSAFDNALSGDSDNYLNYIDLESWVDWLLIQDLLQNFDGAGSNVYMYKQDNQDSSLLFAGPTWDFDNICSQYATFSTFHITYGQGWYVNYWFLLMLKTSFKEAYRAKFDTIKTDLVTKLEERLSVYKDSVYDSMINYDNLRWGNSNDTFASQLSDRMNFMINHLSWMDSNI